MLSAVDAAVMLIDAAKGLEPQTLKLFRVCKARGIPVITVINKWDRPGLDALALMEEIQEEIKLVPTPLTWPVGIAGDFRGVLDRRTGDYVAYTRTAGGATRAPEERMEPPRPRPARETPGPQRSRRPSCSPPTGPTTTRSCSSAASRPRSCSPRRSRTSGWRRCSTSLVELAPPAAAFRHGEEGADGRPAAGPRRRAPFSAFVFKVQAGMDTNHRDRVAFARVCSGVFERGMVAVHAQTGRPFATKYAQAIFGASAPSSTRPIPETSSAWSTRRPADRRHDLPRRAGDVPADRDLRARALRRRHVGRQRPAQAVPARHRPARR